MVEAGVVALVLAFHGVAALSVVAARFVVNGAMFRFFYSDLCPPGQPLALRLPARHPGNGPRLTRPSRCQPLPRALLLRAKNECAAFVRGER